MGKTGKLDKRVSFMWWGYLVAIGSVILATWLKYLAQPAIIPADVPILYILAIVPTAIFFGLGPSILVCILSLVVYDFFFMPPLYTLIGFTDIRNAPIIVIFLVVGVVLSYLASNLRRKNEVANQEIAARRQSDAKLTEYSNQLEDLVRQRTAELEKANLELEHDITERKQMQSKLEEMATHDHLTGLPNRALLSDRFNVAAALAHRSKTGLVLMSLDLDKFKSINDTLGHQMGDRVLIAVSNRLTEVTRASDTLARIGGDEFILLMQDTNKRTDAANIARKILDSLKEPISIDGHELHLSVSIGIAVYPQDGDDMKTLIKKSDAAMYYCKGHGRNRFKFFSKDDAGSADASHLQGIS
jgi:diguanylate cyclase (GGDEF)-like protein